MSNSISFLSATQCERAMDEVISIEMAIMILMETFWFAFIIETSRNKSNWTADENGGMWELKMTF